MAILGRLRYISNKGNILPQLGRHHRSDCIDKPQRLLRYFVLFVGQAEIYRFSFCTQNRQQAKQKAFKHPCIILLKQCLGIFRLHRRICFLGIMGIRLLLQHIAHAGLKHPGIEKGFILFKEDFLLVLLRENQAMAKIPTALAGIVLREVRNTALHNLPGTHTALAVYQRHRFRSYCFRISLSQFIFICRRQFLLHKFLLQPFRLGKGIKTVSAVIQTSCRRNTGIKMLLCHLFSSLHWGYRVPTPLLLPCFFILHSGTSAPVCW